MCQSSDSKHKNIPKNISRTVVKPKAALPNMLYVLPTSLLESSPLHVIHITPQAFFLQQFVSSFNHLFSCTYSYLFSLRANALQVSQYAWYIQALSCVSSIASQYACVVIIALSWQVSVAEHITLVRSSQCDCCICVYTSIPTYHTGTTTDHHYRLQSAIPLVRVLQPQSTRASIHRHLPR